MDWFLYGRDLRYEGVKSNQIFERFHISVTLGFCFVFLLQG